MTTAEAFKEFQEGRINVEDLKKIIEENKIIKGETK